MVIEQYNFQKLQHERQEKTCTIQRFHTDRTGNCMENCFLLFTQEKVYYENAKKPLKKLLLKKNFTGFSNSILKGSLREAAVFYSLLALHMQILSFRACDGTKFVFLEKSAG